MAAIDVVKYLIEQLVDNADGFEVTESEGAINVVAEKTEMGRLIGKQGKTIKAVRTIVRVVGAREGKKYSVDVQERV
jgi:predicted RNA-binding protein YlqC (UPF0109 family)